MMIQIKDLKFIKKLNKFKNKNHHKQKNLGVANSRNIALKFVKVHLTFIDSDDIWKK